MASYFTSSFRFAIGARLVALLLIAPVASSEDVDSKSDEPTNTTAAAHRELVVESALPARRLSLDEALALAVKHNLGVEVARYEPQIAEQDMEGAWGAYDPNFNANVGYELTESPKTFTLNANNVNQSRIIRGGTGLNGLIPYIGANLGIEMKTSQTRSNNSLASFTPQFDSSIFFTAKIPLLRGLIWNEPWTQVKVSKIGFHSSVDGFKQAVMDISESTINAYWALVANHQQHLVARKSLETALALLGQTQTQYEVGVVSRVDVIEAEAGVADREFNLIVARNTFEDSEDALVDAVLGRALKATMNFRLQPADDPEDYEVRDVDIERAVATAIRNLPEIGVADRAIEQKEIELKLAKNSRLPRFDVDARYGYVNISGKSNPRVNFGPPPPDRGGYQSSYDNMFTKDGFENYSVLGTFSVPITNRTARRNVIRGEIDLRRAKTQRARTQQDVILSVRSAARGIRASARGIEAAERRRLAAMEQLRAERIRLEHGESTPFEVLQRESDLVDAKSKKINALQSYRAADARLERAQGTILNTYRIQVDDMRGDSNR